MSIYLYTKQHSVTGLKYFGKTTNDDPYKYKGSGLHWRRHLKKHGKEYIKTLEVWGFDNQEMCTEFALNFSKNNNIVGSKEWANLILENGLDGSPKGRTISAETRAKLSGKTHSPESRAKIGAAQKGKTISAESRAKMSISQTGRTSGNKGKIHSAESRAKIGAAQKGKTISAESRAKMSIAKKGRTFSAEHKAKLSLAANLRNHTANLTIFK